MNNLFNYVIKASETDFNALYKDINSKWNVNAHYGKQGDNVRLFGDDVKGRAEIWYTKRGYVVFVGRDTALYSKASNLLDSGWNDKYNGKKSKNEIALKGVSASDITLLLEVVAIEETPKVEATAETPKATKRRTKSRKDKSVNKAVSA